MQKLLGLLFILFQINYGAEWGAHTVENLLKEIETDKEKSEAWKEFEDEIGKGPLLIKQHNIEHMVDDLWRFIHVPTGNQRLHIGSFQHGQPKGYRYNGLLGAIVSPAAFASAIHEQCPKLFPLFQVRRTDQPTLPGDAPMCQNNSNGKFDYQYRTRTRVDVVRRSFPFAYCALEKNYCGADLPLYSFDGMVTDFENNENVQQYYATSWHNLGTFNKEIFAKSDNPICYIWSRPEHRKQMDLPSTIDNIGLRHVFRAFIPVTLNWDQKLGYYIRIYGTQTNRYQYTKAYVIRGIYKEKMREACPELIEIKSEFDFETGLVAPRYGYCGAYYQPDLYARPDEDLKNSVFANVYTW